MEPDRTRSYIDVTCGSRGVLWLIHQSFYRAFGLSVSMVGVGQAEMVTSAAVFALWVGPLLAYPAVIVRFLFSRAQGRAALLEATFGAVLLIGTMLLLQWASLKDAMRDLDGNSPSGLGILAMFFAMVALLSFVLFVKGLGDLSATAVFYRGIRPARLPSCKRRPTGSVTSWPPGRCLVARDDQEASMQLTPDLLARTFHESYERLAPSFGYATRDDSRQPWEQVPEQNRRLMVATAEAVIAQLGLVASRPASAIRD
jgi:hypothetical protein